MVGIGDKNKITILSVKKRYLYTQKKSENSSFLTAITNLRSGGTAVTFTSLGREVIHHGNKQSVNFYKYSLVLSETIFLFSTPILENA